ncbi:MAG: hypothetical protein AB7O96_15305 [Pseudobdellovibrionaceae bacterium]
MPTLKEFEKTGKKKKPAAPKAGKKAASWDVEEGKTKSGKSTRRPGRAEDTIIHSPQRKKERDMETQIDETDVKMSEDEEIPKTKKTEAADATETETPMQETLDVKEEPFSLDFPYSELVKVQFPKSFDVVEKAAKDWTQDGDFNSLPIEPAIAQFWVGEGLRRAKKVEKKLDQLGVLPLIKYQVTKIREKLQK